MSASDTWADQLIFPPWIDDGLGVLFNEAFLQARDDAGCDDPNGHRFAAPVSFHTGSISDERPENHAA